MNTTQQTGAQPATRANNANNAGNADSANPADNPSTIRRIIGLVIAVIGTGSILALSMTIGQQQHEDIWRHLVYQAVTLTLAAVVTGLVMLITRAPLPRWGNLRAPGRRISLLMIREGESWLRTGTTFAVVISIVTAIYLGSVYGEQFVQAGPRAWFIALGLALVFSTTNALTEELVTRWTVVASMRGSWARFAPWVSAAIFGGAHWFGIPGGPVGALMAGFLAWFLARSMQDTRGIGWAWILHFCQDVLIFTMTLALFV